MKAKYRILEVVNTPSLVGETITINGWVRTKRESKNVAFVALNDGTVFDNLQVVIDVQKFDEELLKNISTGAGVGVTGKLVESQGKGQALEMVAENIVLYGPADPTT